MPDADFVGRATRGSDHGFQPQVVCVFELNGDTAKTVLVGERVHPRLRLDPGVVIVTSTWTVAGCDPVADYVSNNQAAAIARLQPAGPRALEYEYCFTRPGTATLTLTVSVVVECEGGLPTPASGQRTVTYTVLAPSLQEFTAATVPPTLFDTWHDGATWKKLDLAGTNSYDKGFLVRGKVVATAPAMDGGMVRDVQTLLMTRVSDGALLTSGEYVLDGSVPYGPSALTLRQQAPLGWFTEDSPSIVFPPHRRSVENIEVFRLYLQYRAPSPNAIWVTLARWDWFWNVKAELVTEGLPMLLTRWEFAYKSLPGHTLQGAPLASDLPEWNDTIDNVEQRRGPRVGAVTPIDAASAPAVQAAARAGTAPDPTTGPWTAEELTPSSHSDGYRPQDDSQQVMFDPPPFPPPDARLRARIYTQNLLDLTLGPDVVRPNAVYQLAWTSLARVQAFGFQNARILPQDLRCEGLDIRPVPGGEQILRAFRLSVAPFCWGEDQTYWRTIAHGPTGGGPDYRIGAYEMAVRGLAERAGSPVVHGRQLNAWTVEVVFRGMPSYGLVAQIAALAQTARVVRYDGPLPDPYPDDM